MRDTYKDYEYFENYIKKKYSSNDWFQSRLDTNETNPDRIPSVKSMMNKNRLWIIIASYSMGKDVAELKPMYGEVLSKLPDTWGKMSYSNILYIVALGILLNMKEEMRSIVAPLYIEETEKKDWLSSYLILGEDSNDLRVYKPYNFLKEVVEANKDEQVALLKNYVDREWYKGHNQQAWHNSHKSKQETFYGYWSFEAGAIAKLLNLDDAELKNSKFYPYDLVHFEG